MPLETHQASAIDQMKRMGQSTTDRISGSWMTNQPNPLPCCRLKCCPRYRNGTSERARATSGRRVPHGPIPPLNSFQMTPTTPRVLASSGSSSGTTLTTYSSAIGRPPNAPMHESDADWLGEKANSTSRHRCHVSEPRILVTAFPPFSDLETNVSESVLERLERDGIDGLDVVTRMLSVDEAGSNAVATEIRDGIEVDGILHLGLAQRRTGICLERLARNSYSMTEPDNSGRLEETGSIVACGPDALETTASIHVLDEEFEHDADVQWSKDPGGYVCNETIYRTLYELQASTGPALPAIFVHLPPESEILLDQQVAVVHRVARCLVTRPKYEVVGALLFDDRGRILSCRRPNEDAWGGWWEFPGGKIDSDEDPPTALLRELEEELGISPTPKEKVAHIDYEYDDRSVSLQIWNCGVIDPSAFALAEHEAARWLSRDELLDVQWLPADLPIIDKWRREGLPEP